MEENGIVPDIINNPPAHKIQVQYSSGDEVNLGNELTPLSTKDEPSVEWPVEEGQYYTLVMMDPDVPSRVKPLLGSSKHWLVLNIPETDLTKGETIASYNGPGPPEGTGLHRYIFLVYKQTGKMKHSESTGDPNSDSGRLRFNVSKFANKYNLGQPIAANFFLAQCDEYLKGIYAKMAGEVKDYLDINYKDC